MGPRSIFHIAAGSHPVQEAWGHKILCTGVKFKKKKKKSKTISTDSEKSILWPIYDVPFRSYWGKRQRSIYGSAGVKQVKIIQFCWQRYQSARLVNTIQSQNSFLWSVNMVLLWERLVSIGWPSLLRNHSNEASHIW